MSYSALRDRPATPTRWEITNKLAAELFDTLRESDGDDIRWADASFSDQTGYISAIERVMLSLADPERANWIDAFRPQPHTA